jgi:uncharacterized membrane protein YkvA (DUF1232 family)
MKNMTRFGLWGRLLEDFQILFLLIKDYWNGTYREVSLYSIIVFTLTIAYILSPYDLLTDFIPGLGQIDDVIILLFCLYFLEKDLYKYNSWKIKQEQLKEHLNIDTENNE